MKASPLKVSRESDILHVVLSRPERGNALDAGLVEALHDALDEAMRHPPRLLVIQGAGNGFSSGFDLGELDAENDETLLERFVRMELLLQRVFHLPFATLALAHGRCFGAGADLFCACQTRIAAPHTTFRMPGWKFGIALGTRRLVHRIGAEAAQRMLMESRVLGAEEACNLGLATGITTQDGWHQVMLDRLAATAGLDAIAITELLAITTPDTREEDLAAIRRTAGRPGLASRIAAYREAERARAMKK